jgi:hypothetical protein
MQPLCSWLFHCLVPAAKWWDDIVFTWSNMLFFQRLWNFAVAAMPNV